MDKEFITQDTLCLATEAYKKVRTCMARAWHVHGMCMACAWHVHGMCMACAWHVHGMCMACAWLCLATEAYKKVDTDPDPPTDADANTSSH
eukprot:scaffold20451_cov31-Phaeocystis_antarctica.AAC.2